MLEKKKLSNKDLASLVSSSLVANGATFDLDIATRTFDKLKSIKESITTDINDIEALKKMLEGVDKAAVLVEKIEDIKKTIQEGVQSKIDELFTYLKPQQ